MEYNIFRSIFTKLIIVLFVIIQNISYAQDEGGLNISGYFRTDVGTIFVISNDSLDGYYYIGKNTLRLDFGNNDTTYGKIEGSIDFYLLSGRYVEFLLAQTNGISIGQNIILSYNIRKLYLMVRFDWADVSIGRQLLKFGQGLVFSPINFFDKLDISDINFSRTGEDIVRIKIPLGDRGGLDFVSLPRTEITNSDISTRILLPVLGFDVEGIIGYFGKDGYIRGGLSFKVDLEIGLYGEVVYNYHRDESNRYLELTIGGDYSFFDKLIVRGEYYYNSFDVNQLPLYKALNLKNYPFLSHQYSMIQLSYLPDITSSITLSFIKNLEKEGFLIYFGLTKNLFQNVNLYLDTRLIYRDITGIVDTQLNTIYTSVGLDVIF